MKSTLFLAALTALALTSCRTTSMRVEASPVSGVNYAAYKTYKWEPLSNKEANNISAEDKLLRDAFIQESDSILARNGFTKVDQGKSDLLVYARGLRMPSHREVGKTPEFENAYRPNRNGEAWLTYSATNQSGYLAEETSRSVRFLISEPDSDRIVWRGKAFLTIDNQRVQAMQLKDARTVARKLLEGFPPKN